MILLLGLMHLAAAGAPLPDYQAGDAFVYSDGRVEQVHRVEGDTVLWSGLGRGSRYLRSRNPIVPILQWQAVGTQATQTIAGHADSLWPLVAGKSVRFRALAEIRKGKTKRRYTAFWKCMVGATGKVAVPAGVFDAWPIQCDRYSSTSMRLVERISWDWSAELGHYVRRRVTRYSTGATQEIVLEAALSAEIATPQRLKALSEHAVSHRQRRK